ncbi:MAG TPA: amino acid adenylation domain-containing protein [Thermoanaerobaculia bacterium]|nr:amino acid adenylation domain-containing protein [Thermoanaerobaculia bacterium]
MVTSNLTGFRLSPQQESVWRAQGSRPALGFVCQGLLEIRGPLDRSLLRHAVERIVERHEILRTSFRRLPGMSLPVQVVQDRGEVLWSEPETSGKVEAEVERRFAEARRSPSLLEDGAALQASLLSLGEERHALLLTLPVLATDALSLRFLSHEIATLYGGEESTGGLPEPLQYADAAESLQDWLGPEDGPGAAFWRQQGSPSLLPADAPEHAVPETGHRRLPSGPVAGLAQQIGVPVPLLLLAAWSATLWWETGEERRTLAVAHDGRTFDELSGAVGPYARYLPLQSVVGPGITLGELARSLEGAFTTAASWQDTFSFDRLATGSASEGPVPYWPVGFDSDRTAVLSPAMSLWPVFVGLGRFGLRLSVLEEDAAVRLDLHYDPSRQDRGQAERLLDRLERVLAGATAGRETPLGEIDVLSEAERRELLVGFNDTAAPYPAEATVCDLFEERVRLAPQAPAVAAAEGLSLTFEELDARANRLARHLRSLGIGPESRVGIHLEREPEMVVTLLAVLKAGGAYVPFDAGHPAERLRFLMQDAGLAALVTRERLRPAGAETIRTVLVDPGGADAEAVSREGTTPPPRLAGPDNAAYVIYTSGSTGLPKGVVVTHRGLVNYLCWARTAYGTSPGKGAPVHSPLGFDLTVTSLFVPLLTGAPITLVPEEDGIGALAEALCAPRVRGEGAFGLAKITPAHLGLLRQLTADGEPPPSAACLVIGGDALWAADIAPWRRQGTRIFNEYGPTETVVGCCIHEVTPESPEAGAVPIGRPIANTRLYVMGPGLRPVPAGVPGELWIGGDGVARGYLGRAGLTAERFVPDPFALPDQAGGRLYRTGDLVCLRSPGSGTELEFLGRIDDQIKIRGHRVEPGEVAAALGSHPGLRDAAVALRSVGDDRRLVAWIVARDRARRPAATELRRFLAERLPEPMIPAAFVHLDVLPLTPNGKLDRRALPDPDLQRDEETPYVPPRTLSEEVLAEIWGQVLGVDRVGIDDHFFLLGGDSIRSLQVLSLAQKRGLALTLQDVFQQPTIRGLAKSARRDGAAPAPEPDLTPFALVSPADRQRLAPGIEDAYPVSQLQMGMLFHTERDPTSAVFHVQHSFAMSGRFDPELMQSAIDLLVKRHPILRTSFDLAGFGEPLQLVHAAVKVPLGIEDLSTLEPEVQREAVLAWLEESRHRPFDWTQPPLVRFHAHLFGEDGFQFTLSLHHAVLDGWSVAVMLSELFRLYLAQLRGTSHEEPPLASSFRELVSLERSLLASPAAAEFWDRYLDGAEPTTLPRGGASRSEASGIAVIPTLLSPDLSEGLRRLARAATVPLKSVLLSAHLRALSLLSGRTDISTGLVSHSRPERQDSERVLGMFLNTIPLRLHLAGGTWIELVQATFDAERAVLPFCAFPLPELQRRQGGRPLFETVLNFLHFHAYQSVMDIPGLTAQSSTDYEEINYPLMVTFALSLVPGSPRITLQLNYHPAELGAEEAQGISRRYQAILEAMVADPASRYDTPLLSAAEQHQILVEWNDHEAAGPGPCIHRMFEAQAMRRADAVAITGREESLTYGELYRRASVVAHRLRALGVGPEVRVALCLERTPDLVSATLGVLAAGGAYLPLDPSYPRERLSFVLEDSNAALLLTERHLAGVLPEGGPPRIWLDELRCEPAAETAVFPADVTDPQNLAYVIYTSGSTGRPKGVQVPHSALTNFLVSVGKIPGLTSSDALLAVTTFSFDIAALEIFLPLTKGARVEIAPHDAVVDAERLAALLRSGITAVQATPATWRMLLESGWTGSPDLKLLSGGEALPRNLADRLLGASGSLWNLYGPTETTIWSAVERIAPGTGPIAIGRPLDNTRIYIHSSAREPVPAGVPGELYIGGDGLARGYLGRPDLTAERFVPSPDGKPGARLYRTGDLARHLPDGRIEFLGRIDHQVKIRGFRIEPGEIESALAGLAGVREAVVVAREDTPGDLRLVAYVVGEVAADGLRQSLRERLPDYMIPAAFVTLSELPLTPNGKVDRKALPAPEGQRAEKGHLAPRTPVEEVLAGIWAEVLGLEQIGATDHFFDRGGHSLLASRVMSRLRSTFGIEMPLRALFEAPMLADLAARVEAARRAGADQLIPPLLPTPRKGPVPLSFAQQRLWFLDQLEPGSPLYNMPVALRVEGPLSCAVLALCLGEIVRRHSALRTVFTAIEGSPVQVIQPATPFKLPVVDLSGLPARKREALALTLGSEEVVRPFDLTRDPLLRAVLLRLAERDHVVALTMHHIVSDAWSIGILVREVTPLYAAFAEGRPSPLPELSVQYADFAVWQHGWLNQEALKGMAEYWRNCLAGAPPQLDLPGIRPRPAALSPRGAACQRRFSAPLLEQLRTLSRCESATLFMILLASLQALLHSRTGATDLVVGTDVAGRDRRETEGLVGFFINQLPLRADLAGNPTLRELLGRVRETALDAYAHQDLPFDHLVEALRIEQSLRRSPVFQVKLVLQNAPRESLDLPGLTLKVVPLSTETAQLDLHWSVVERGEELWLTLTYSTDLYDEPLIDGLLDQYELWLHAFAERPDAQLGDVVAELAQAERARRAERGLELKSKGLGKLRGLRRQAEELKEVGS